jgi:BirA family biotin operon repressor/biotin-[acetyl-CoA-carboxylase] ligase
LAIKTLLSTGRHSVSVLLDERVQARLASETRFDDIRWLAETDSTNRLVADLAASGEPEGLVVATDFQVAGRGRLDRRWDARPGDGLLVSVLLRPVGLGRERWHLVTAGAGLAAQDACRRVAEVEVSIKWPNDLLVDGSKLAGILAEASGAAVVVGMGLNVHSGPPGAAVLDQAAGRRVSRAELLEQWLRSYDSMLGDWDRLAALYRAGCATVGQEVSVELSRGETLRGIAEDVDELGRLLVRDADGRRHAVAVGDVTHLRW